MPISSDELVALALEISGMDRLPADSCVLVPGEAMTKLMFGIDIGSGELLLARELGCDGSPITRREAARPGTSPRSSPARSNSWSLTASLPMSPGPRHSH
jgi:hypothetical protein